MERWLEIAKTVPRLGWARVARVARHRWRTRAGTYQKALFKPVAVGPLFEVAQLSPSRLSPTEATRVLEAAQKLRSGRLTLFGVHEADVGSPPRWHENPLSNSASTPDLRHWSVLTDFDPSFGDIKGQWEVSRFSWAPVLAQAALASRDAEFVRTLETWTQDWWAQNPWGHGRNWKCGQETSLRLLHVLEAAHLLGITPASSPRFLNDFVTAHALRIDLTRDYAKGQANNHALSEAVGLFVAGEWLRTARAGHDTPETRRWRRHGREDLEEGVAGLFETDGTFAQYSTTYHRMALDLLSHATRWAAALTPEEPFSEVFRIRARAATRWLAAVVDDVSGDAANLGSNDGAHVLNDTLVPYRDFRPSLARARACFAAPADAAASQEFSLGGFVVVRTSASWGCLRAPRARFRPVQADALHLDVWHRGINILRDAGTYSYFDAEGAALASCEGHNTLQFDGRDQMPKLSRFLYGSWTDVRTLSPLREAGGVSTWSGEYRDPWGVRHRRSFEARATEWRVVDEFRGHQREALARWRLAPADWQLRGTTLESSLARLEILAPEGAQMELRDAWESRYYSARNKVPLLTVRLGATHGRLETRLLLKEAP